MPPAAHNRVIVQATLTQAVGGGSEIAEFGWADMSTKTPMQLAQLTDTLLSTDWALGTHALQISSKAVYAGVRAEAIDAAGHVTSSYFQTATTPSPGANSSQPITVVCFAVTLETGVLSSTGRKVRGRFYPPAGPTAVIGSTAAAGDVTAYASAWAGFLHDYNTAGGVVAVASSTSAGLVAATGTSCDNTVDTQRRRKNRVTSVRSSVQAI